MFWLTLLFALAVSLDGFGVGLTYGIRNIKIPLKSLFVIFVISAIAIALSMGFGRLITSVISGNSAKICSGLLLMILGGWVVLKSWLQLKKNGLTQEIAVFKWQIPSLGIVVQILCEPDLADADYSGSISLWEAFYLGIALALDAFGAGLALAMAGFSIAMTMTIVGFAQILMIVLGIYFGKIGIPKAVKGKIAFIPGFILMILGLWKLY